MNASIVPYNNENRQPSIFKFDDCDIRVIIGDDGEPLFVASDLCKALGISNVSNVLSRLDDDEKDDIRVADAMGRIVSTAAVNESGMYSIILRSDKAKAKAFKRCVTHEILPSIRRTGKYEIEPQSIMTSSRALLAVVQKLVDIEDEQIAHRYQINGLTETVGEQALAIENIREELADRDFFTIEQWCSKQGMKITPSISSKWGKDAKASSRARGIEVKEFYDRRYPKPLGRYHKSVLLDVCVAKPKPNPQQSLFNYDEE